MELAELVLEITMLTYLFVAKLYSLGCYYFGFGCIPGHYIHCLCL